MEYKDYYKVLGLERNANQDEIKRTYRKLARKYHPDVNKAPDAEERFKEVGEAYEVLKDPEKRAAYDQLGSQWQAGQNFRAPPDWDAGFEFSGGGFTGADTSAYSDFFESLFGRAFHGGRGRAAHGFDSRGEDHHAKIMVDLGDSFTGATRKITLRIPALNEQGRLQAKERVLNVKIPRGVQAGQSIRLAGQGASGPHGAAPGDLYLQIEFNPHPFYRVDGKDVYIDLPLAPWEAALGATVKVPTPGGFVDLKIPPESKSGKTLRLKGRGIPATPPGDLYAVIRIALPPADTEKAKALYRRMAEELKFNPRAHLEA